MTARAASSSTNGTASGIIDPVSLMRIKSLELRERGPVFISCPTCGRCQIDLIPVAEEVERRLAEMEAELRNKDGLVRGLTLARDQAQREMEKLQLAVAEERKAREDVERGDDAARKTAEAAVRDLQAQLAEQAAQVGKLQASQQAAADEAAELKKKLDTLNAVKEEMLRERDAIIKRLRWDLQTRTR